MPALHFPNEHLHPLHKRLLEDDDGDISTPRILGVVFVIIVVLIILFIAFKSVTVRRRRRVYNTARNQGPVRVQRLETRHQTSPSTENSSGLPSWGNSLNPRVATSGLEGGVAAPPPVYMKDQDGNTLLRDPPPPYEGRQGAS